MHLFDEFTQRKSSSHYFRDNDVCDSAVTRVQHVEATWKQRSTTTWGRWPCGARTTRHWRSASRQTRPICPTRRPIVRSAPRVLQPAVTPTVSRVCRSVRTCPTRGNPLPVTHIRTTGGRTCTWRNITNTVTDITGLVTKVGKHLVWSCHILKPSP